MHIDLNFVVMRTPEQHQSTQGTTKVPHSDTARYCALLDSMETAVIAHTPDTKIVFFNSRACEILGLSAEQLQGKSATDPHWHFLNQNHERIPHDEYPAFLVLKSDKPLKNRVYGINRGGYQPLVWVNVNGVPVHNEHGELVEVIISFNDITDRITAEERHKSSDLQFQNLFLNAADAIFIGVAATGKILDANKAAEKLLNRTRDEILNMYQWELHPERLSEIVRDLFSRSKEHIEAINVAERTETFVVKSDGSEVPVDIWASVVQYNGEPCLMGTFRDMSEQKNSEQKLKDNQTRFQDIAESNQTVIWEVDSSGLYTYVSPASESQWGYHPSELIGQKHFFDIHPEAGREEFKAQAFQLFDTKSIVKDFVNVIRNKNGKTITVISNGLPILREDGELIGYRGSDQDITEIKRIELNLRENQTQLRQLLGIKDEQNRRMMDFTHIVSHNLRSHSANMEGLMMLMKMEEPDLFEHEYVQLMHHSSKSLSETIDNLNKVLDIGRTEQKEWREIDVSILISGVLEVLQSLAQSERVTLTNEVPGGWMVKVIPAYMESIVRNLVSNAIRFRSPDREAFVRVFADKEPSGTVIHFEDNGVGIDMERHGNKLFGMYRTFHTHHQSKGLGLFITKNQIQAMNGDIKVSSRPGEGATFSVHLIGN
jgi:PAS domain S-box-containing protein